MLVTKIQPLKLEAKGIYPTERLKIKNNNTTAIANETKISFQGGFSHITNEEIQHCNAIMMEHISKIMAGFVNKHMGLISLFVKEFRVENIQKAMLDDLEKVLKVSNSNLKTKLLNDSDNVIEGRIAKICRATNSAVDHFFGANISFFRNLGHMKDAERTVNLGLCFVDEINEIRKLHKQ